MIVRHRVVGQQPRTEGIWICHKEIGRNSISCKLTRSPVDVASGECGTDACNIVIVEVVDESRILKSVSSTDTSGKEPRENWKRNSALGREEICEAVRRSVSGVDREIFLGPQEFLEEPVLEDVDFIEINCS